MLRSHPLPNRVHQETKEDGNGGNALRERQLS
jgi:hypothetical protein